MLICLISVLRQEIVGAEEQRFFTGHPHRICAQYPHWDTPHVPCAANCCCMFAFVSWFAGCFFKHNICAFWVFFKTQKHSNPTIFDMYLHVTVKRIVSWSSWEAFSSLLAALPYPLSTSPQSGTNQVSEGTDPRHSWIRSILCLSRVPELFSLLLPVAERSEQERENWLCGEVLRKFKPIKKA